MKQLWRLLTLALMVALVFPLAYHFVRVAVFTVMIFIMCMMVFAVLEEAPLNPLLWCKSKCLTIMLWSTITTLAAAFVVFVH